MAPKISETHHPWFDHSIRVYAHHTDYAGVVWHGTYLQWLEESRIEALNQVGVGFNDLVRCDCDLPVIDLAIRYHQPLRLGDDAIAKCRLSHIHKVRLHFDQQIYKVGATQPVITAQVVLIPVNRTQGNTIIRKFPPQLAMALERLQTAL